MAGKSPIDDVIHSTAISKGFPHLISAAVGESPLLCALMCAAHLDQALDVVLRRALIKGGTTDGLLKDNGGVLGTFYNRARIAYAMGLIDKVVFNNLQKIGEIRNIFAHRPTPVSFDDPEIITLCSELRDLEHGIDIGIGQRITSALKPQTDRPARQRLIDATIVTVWALSMLAHDTKPPALPALRASDGKPPTAATQE